MSMKPAQRGTNRPVAAPRSSTTSFTRVPLERMEAPGPLGEYLAGCRGPDGYRFARGMHAWRLVADLPFDKHGTSYERRVADTFREAGVAVVEEPFAAGDVSFHSTLCFHTAGANRATRPRTVLGSTYFADGTRLVEQPTMVSGDWRLFVPDTAPGERAASANNPVLRTPR